MYMYAVYGVEHTSFKLGGNSPKCGMEARNWQYWGYSFNLTKTRAKSLWKEFCYSDRNFKLKLKSKLKTDFKASLIVKYMLLLLLSKNMFKVMQDSKFLQGHCIKIKVKKCTMSW